MRRTFALRLDQGNVVSLDPDGSGRLSVTIEIGYPHENVALRYAHGKIDRVAGKSSASSGRHHYVGIDVRLSYVFDGNYESMASDWLFMPDITRAIHVDVRYVLWIMDAVDKAHDPDLPTELLLRMYRAMTLVRQVDERCMILQRQGRIGFYGASTGEEAAAIGSIAALRDTDWAFPALDHPCLWNSPTRAVPVDDTTVVWFGTDYLGHRAASVRAARTTIEISVLDGEFTDDELLALVRSLQPVSAEAALALSATPFADLSYWARYDASMVDVPVGLWRFRRPDRPHEGAWTAEPAGVARLLSSLPLPAALGSLAPDSAAVFENQAGRSEIEVVYAGGPGRGCELRLIAQGAARGRLVVPSERESHPCTTGRLTLEDVEVQLAWIDARYGPFDAVWADPVAGLELKLLSTTGVGLSRAWFLSAVREAIVACRARGAG